MKGNHAALREFCRHAEKVISASIDGKYGNRPAYQILEIETVLILKADIFPPYFQMIKSFLLNLYYKAAVY